MNGRLIHGDCRTILPTLDAETVITDPPWVGANVDIEGCERAQELFAEMVDALPDTVVRVAVQLGCNTDPGMLAPLSKRFAFFRVATLDYACPSYRGRLLHTGDVAYLYGDPPPSRAGAHLIGGRFVSSSNRGADKRHPCPRNLEHVNWLVDRWGYGKIVDPFAGIGTTIVAAASQGKDAVGIEVDAAYVDVANERLAMQQPTLVPS